MIRTGKQYGKDPLDRKVETTDPAVRKTEHLTKETRYGKIEV